MKFIASSSALSKQLNIIGGVLNTNNTLPILDDFMFEIKKNELTVSASDLETTITTKLKLTEKAEKPGSITIPARLLMDILKSFPEQPLTFLIDDNTYGIEICCDQGKYKLTGHSANEFPRIPSIESATSLELASPILLQALSKTIFATGNDELRPVMNGVLCRLSPDDITFVATDAHKLSKYNRKGAKSKVSASFIIPKKPLNLLKNILPAGKDDTVNIEYNESNVFFSFGTVELICRLVDGKYPNYEAVIPKSNPNILTIDRLAFLNSINRVSIFANKTTQQVRLKISGSEINISAEDLEFANEANETLTCQYKGEDMEIGFNSRFLIEILSNLDTKDIHLELSEPNRAGIILPSNGNSKDENILMLVMPVMLNQ